MISSRRLIPLLVLSFVSLAVWCGLTHRWSLEAWSTPLQIHGDPLEVYARVQAASEDLAQPLLGFNHLPRLGAPVGANWRRYPVSDRVVFTGLGLLARILGVFAAVNVAMAAVHVLNAIAFYLCARFLRWRIEWAMATALLFSFSSYNFRWGVTVSFSLTFFVPVLLLFCAWVARSAPAVKARPWTWVGCGLGAWLGGANPYLSFFASQLIAGALLLQYVRGRDRARSRAGWKALGVLAVSFLLHYAAYFTATTEGEHRITLSRSYAGSEIYALKLADLLIPASDHPIPVLAQIGRAYHAQTALRTEFFVNYLGFAGVAGLALLLAAALRAIVRARRSPPDAALGVMWTLLFSAVGGVNSLLALGGLDLFRASNRNSVFILCWALFYFGSWCQRRWQPSFPLLRFGVPLAIVLLSVADGLPKLRAEKLLQENSAILSNHQSVLGRLEKQLGSNANVFQLPATLFPESGTVVLMGDYEHFLPYLTSTSLRFSYGALRGTALSRTLRSMSRVSAGIMKDELESAGFSAIWVDRRGNVEGGRAIIEELKSLGAEEFLQTELPDIVILALHPATTPRPLDLANPRLLEPWDVILSLKKPELIVYNGWYDIERDKGRSWRWAQNTATTGILMPSTGTVQLSFWAYSLERGEVVLELNGIEVSRHRTTPSTRDQRVVTLKLRAGRHRLVWRYTGRVVRPVETDGRKLGFAIENLAITQLPEGDPATARSGK
ncbi:MAG: hypothetical protein ABIV50_15775 [Opitutus sp.]